MNEPTTPAAGRIKLTRKVRRGLALVRGFLIDAADPDRPPVYTQLARLGARETSDFNRAMAWLEENERTEATAGEPPAPGQEKTDG